MVSSRRGEGLIFPKARRVAVFPRCLPPWVLGRQCAAFLSPCRPARGAAAAARAPCACTHATHVARRAASGLTRRPPRCRVAGRRTRLRPRLPPGRAWRRRACAASCRRVRARCRRPTRIPRTRAAAAAGRRVRLPAFRVALTQQGTTPRRCVARLAQELGSFRFTSKSHRCVAHVFVMRVTEARASRTHTLRARVTTDDARTR
jgi:hypothetical protein